MRTDVRYPQLIPMVRAVLDTLDGGIAAEEDSATDLARLARTLGDDHTATNEALLKASRQHAIKALEIRGRRAALLSQYGLA